MIVAVRYRAWLAAVPDKQQASRFERATSDGVAIEFPWVEPELTYLLDYLYDVGPILRNTAGNAPLSCAELLAWERLAGVELQPWESKLLRRLSGEYLGMANRATDPTCPCPYQSEAAIRANRDAVSKQISVAMKAYKMSRGE